MNITLIYWGWLCTSEVESFFFFFELIKNDYFDIEKLKQTLNLYLLFIITGYKYDNYIIVYLKYFGLIYESVVGWNLFVGGRTFFKVMHIMSSPQYAQMLISTSICLHFRIVGGESFRSITPRIGGVGWQKNWGGGPDLLGGEKGRNYCLASLPRIATLLDVHYY